MKFITVLQPQASLLALGAIRQIESHRYTAYRGRVAICASTFPYLEQIKLKTSPFRWKLLSCYTSDELDAGHLPTGQIVGFVTLEDCVIDKSIPAWVEGYQAKFSWLFTEPRLLPVPLPCEAGSGLSDLPENLAQRLEVFA